MSSSVSAELQSRGSWCFFHLFCTIKNKHNISLNVKLITVHPLQPFVGLPGKWRTRTSKTENQRERAAEMVSKWMCDWEPRQLRMSASLSHGRVFRLSHTHTHSECTADIPEVPHPSHSTSLPSSPLPFPSSLPPMFSTRVFLLPSFYSTLPQFTSSSSSSSSDCQSCRHPTPYEPCLEMSTVKEGNGSCMSHGGVTPSTGGVLNPKTEPRSQWLITVHSHN